MRTAQSRRRIPADFTADISAGSVHGTDGSVTEVSPYAAADPAIRAD